MERNWSWVIRSICRLRKRVALLVLLVIGLIVWNGYLAWSLNETNARLDNMLMPTCKEEDSTPAIDAGKDLSSFTLTEVPVIK